MKTFIALSSILAAGTLFANAATPLTFDIPVGQAGQTSASVRLDTGAISSISSYILDLAAGIYGGGNNTGWIDNWASIGDCTVTKNVSDYTIKVAGRSGVDGEWFGSVYNFDAESVSTGDYVSSLKLDLTVGSEGAYGVLLFAKYTNGLTVVSDERQTVETNTSGSVSLALTEKETALSKVAFVIIGPGNGTTATYDISGVNFSAGISTIPEPSMFGLLAGIGALALAGTRRRKK